MKYLMIVLLIAFTSAHASMSESFDLTGKIVSFDEKTVTIKSGSMLYTFPKKDLNHPSFKVGDQIAVPTTEAEFKKLKGKPAK